MSSLLILSIIWVLTEVIISRMLRADKPKTDLDRSSLKILWITISASVTAGIMTRSSTFDILSSDSHILYNTGITFVALGLLVRWLAIFSLKQAFTVNVNIAEDQKLIQSGLYKFIRHPSYSGSLLSFAGLGIAFNNWLTLLIILVPVFLAFLYRIKVEEDALLDAFGAGYSEYIKDSWKLVPWIF